MRMAMYFYTRDTQIKKKENKLCRLFSDENINQNYSKTKPF